MSKLKLCSLPRFLPPARSVRTREKCYRRIQKYEWCSFAGSLCLLNLCFCLLFPQKQIRRSHHRPPSNRNENCRYFPTRGLDGMIASRCEILRTEFHSEPVRLWLAQRYPVKREDLDLDNPVISEPFAWINISSIISYHPTTQHKGRLRLRPQ